jgi:putative ABC transport system permease protein
VIDNVNDVRSWYRKTIIADFFLRAMAPDMATGLAADLPDSLGAEVRKVPGITSLDTVRLVSVKAASEQVIMIVRSFDDPALQEFDLVSGDPATVRESLNKGEVVVGSVLAERAKLKVGESITLETEQGERKFKIAAVTNDYQAGGLTMYVDREIAKQLLNIGGVDAYVIKADHKRLQEVKDELQKLADKYGILLESHSDIQHQIDAMMAGVVAGLWGMVVLGLVVAAFGVTNTLMMTVLEQTREFGLLRVVAMTRKQVRKTIFAQALVMGLLALVPGVFAGVGVAYLIHLATEPVIGHPVKFVPHPWLIAGGLAFGMLIVAIAAWMPAERASRLELTQALRMA